jgi:hypothetical protein
MLVDLNISVWTARKLDKKTGDEIIASKQAKNKQAASVSKHLLAGVTELSDIAKIAGEARLMHYFYTLPWSDSGTRLLTTAAFMEYKQKMGELKTKFDDAVHSFLMTYPTLIAGMQLQLGDLFNVAEYPSAQDIANKFNFGTNIYPLPDAGDFRVDIGNAAKAELEAQYKDIYERQLKSAMDEAWTRLHDTLKHMSERLEGNNIFRDSLVENANELCNVLQHLNVTNDPNLARARKMLEDAMFGIKPIDLREDELMRTQTRTAVNDILGKFGW